jgi:hypothetical protein
VVAALQKLPVFARPQLDRVEAAVAVALAVKPLRRLDPVQLGAGLDPLVDAPKHLLVPGGPLCEVHGRTVPTALTSKRGCPLPRSGFMYRYRLIDEETGSEVLSLRRTRNHRYGSGVVRTRNR